MCCRFLRATNIFHFFNSPIFLRLGRNFHRVISQNLLSDNKATTSLRLESGIVRLRSYFADLSYPCLFVDLGLLIIKRQACRNPSKIESPSYHFSDPLVPLQINRGMASLWQPRNHSPYREHDTCPPQGTSVLSAGMLGMGMFPNLRDIAMTKSPFFRGEQAPAP